MKKWLILFGIIFVVQIPFNLHYHAYYYATHMKDDGDKYYRFAPLLGNNYLPQSYVPGYKVEHIDLREATNNIIIKDNILKKGDKLEIDFNSSNYYPNKNKDDYYSISFENDGKVYSIDIVYSNGKEEKLSKNNITRKRAYSSLNQFNETLKENSRRPIINLQWLWNMWYQVSN